MIYDLWHGSRNCMPRMWNYGIVGELCGKGIGLVGETMGRKKKIADE